jgi:hypothetical protein
MSDQGQSSDLPAPSPPATGGTLRCPNGHENLAGQAFCGTCGTALPQAQPFDTTRFPFTPTPRPKRSKRPFVFAGIAVCVVAVTAAVFFLAGPGSKPTSSTHALRLRVESPFGGTNAVTVEDPNHKVIGAATVTWPEVGCLMNGCWSTTTVSDLPQESLYTVFVKDTPVATYSSATLKKDHWAESVTSCGC